MTVAQGCCRFLLHISDMAWLVAYSLFIHVDAKHIFSSQPVTVSVVLGGKMGMTSKLQGLPRSLGNLFLEKSGFFPFGSKPHSTKHVHIAVSPNNNCRVLSSCRSAPRFNGPQRKHHPKLRSA